MGSIERRKVTVGTEVPRREPLRGRASVSFFLSFQSPHLTAHAHTHTHARAHTHNTNEKAPKFLTNQKRAHPHKILMK